MQGLEQRRVMPKQRKRLQLRFLSELYFALANKVVI
jgi:hypothetical protein